MKTYMFVEHADGSYFGRGPWMVSPGEPDPVDGTFTIECTPDGFCYVASILVTAEDLATKMVQVGEVAS